MKVRGLDNKEHSINLALYIKQRTGCSSLHLKTRQILKEVFPLEQILEEVPLPSTRLFADFFIPSKDLIIEVNGEQHYKMNSFHHKNKMSFYKGQKRDRTKEEWCILNGIELIVLSYEETEDEWRTRIIKRNS